MALIGVVGTAQITIAHSNHTMGKVQLSTETTFLDLVIYHLIIIEPTYFFTFKPFLAVTFKLLK